MKRISYTILGFAALLLVASTAFATPWANSVVLKTRIFNDCPGSVLIPTNTYPALVEFDEDGLDCFGWANLHNWTLSQDGVNPHWYGNGDAFTLRATLVISGNDVNGSEAGLRVGPWWSPNVDGRFNVRVPDGEIAAFGGVLPFYSFSDPGGFNLHYTKGNPISLEIQYDPRSNTVGDEGRVQYEVVYLGNTYTSPWLTFGNCTLGEEWHGCYGIMDNARLGGFAQHRLTNGDPSAHAVSSFFDIFFLNTAPTAVKASTWGTIKAIYR